MKFSESYEEALAICKRRRPKIPPAVYNQQRTIEPPIPVIVPSNDEDTDQSLDQSTNLNENDESDRDENNYSDGDGISDEHSAHSNENNETIEEVLVNIENHALDDSTNNNTAISAESETEPEIDTPQNQNAENDQIIDPIKPESVILMEPSPSNNSELQNLLDEDEEEIFEYDESVTLIINKKVGMAKPFKTNNQELIKRENDVVSGDLPYNETVTIIAHFFYIFFQHFYLKFFSQMVEFICLVRKNWKFH